MSRTVVLWRKLCQINMFNVVYFSLLVFYSKKPASHRKDSPCALLFEKSLFLAKRSKEQNTISPYLRKFSNLIFLGFFFFFSLLNGLCMWK